MLVAAPGARVELEEIQIWPMAFAMPRSSPLGQGRAARCSWWVSRGWRRRWTSWRRSAAGRPRSAAKTVAFGGYCLYIAGHGTLRVPA